MENNNYFVKYLSKLADQYKESSMLNDLKSQGFLLGPKASEVKDKSSVVNDKDTVEPETKTIAEEENKAEQKSEGVAKSTALNINWNILYYPGDASECQPVAIASSMEDTALSLYDLLSKVLNDEKENATNVVAEAKSESEIKNKNVNIVVHF